MLTHIRLLWERELALCFLNLGKLRHLFPNPDFLAHHPHDHFFQKWVLHEAFEEGLTRQCCWGRRADTRRAHPISAWWALMQPGSLSPYLQTLGHFLSISIMMVSTPFLAHRSATPHTSFKPVNPPMVALAYNPTNISATVTPPKDKIFCGSSRCSRNRFVPFHFITVLGID